MMQNFILGDVKMCQKSCIMNMLNMHAEKSHYNLNRYQSVKIRMLIYEEMTGLKIADWTTLWPMPTHSNTFTIWKTEHMSLNLLMLPSHHDVPFLEIFLPSVVSWIGNLAKEAMPAGLCSSLPEGGMLYFFCKSTVVAIVLLGHSFRNGITTFSNAVVILCAIVLSLIK